MKIEQSSAEFLINNQFVNAYFGIPQCTTTTGEYGVQIHYPTGGFAMWKQVSMPISQEDIQKLSMWDNYREEINGLYKYGGADIAKDKYGQYWICIGGTGWATNWTVSLGTLESGKYPV